MRKLQTNNYVQIILQEITNNSDQKADSDYDRISKIFAELDGNISKFTCSRLENLNNKEFGLAKLVKSRCIQHIRDFLYATLTT